MITTQFLYGPRSQPQFKIKVVRFHSLLLRHADKHIQSSAWESFNNVIEAIGRSQKVIVHCWEIVHLKKRIYLSIIDFTYNKIS